MAEQNTKTFVDTIVEAQKNVVDTVVENTRRLANGNTFLDETAQKGGEWYKNWLENQKQAVGTVTEQATHATDNTKQAASRSAEFFQNWYNQQMEWAKRFWDTNTGFVQNAANAATNAASSASSNPMDAMMGNWNNATQTWNNWMQGMANMNQWQNTMNNWMNQAQSSNPFSMDAWKNVSSNFNGFFNQWHAMLSNGYAEWQKNLENGVTQDAFRNMIDSTEGFTRFAEMWMPMWKSIQEKTFNTEMFRQFMNPAQYQELMDKYFGFVPAPARAYMQQLTTLMQDAMKQSSTAGLNAYQQFRSTAGQMMPFFNHTDAFGQMMAGYNQMQSFFESAVSPITKMMTPNAATKHAAEWQDIMNRLVQFSIKNSEMQYMTYQQGAKVMDRLAENITAKIQSGQEINSLMSLYQEWLNLSDSTFVQLFESDEYSKIMAEVSAMQLRLKKDIETQMEKAMVHVPVATRSELDELYKTIYDLKKQVRELERKNEAAPVASPNAASTISSEANNEASRPATNGRAKK